MDLYEQMGPMALGSRLRRLGERLADNARDIYALYGVDLDPRWFPVYYALSVSDDGLSTTDLADRIGHSHASVSQIVSQMRRRGLVAARRSSTDRRVNEIRLTQRGRAIDERIARQYIDVNAAVLELLAESERDLLAAVGEAEKRLSERSMTARVRDKFRAREGERVAVVDYEARYQDDFRRLNYEWIERYFQVEPADRETLEDPEGKVIEPGGYIAIALHDGIAVGTCALLRHDDESFELAKMAVTSASQGLGIGTLLGRKVIEVARERGAAFVFLESNRKLTPALNLYRQLGFRETTGKPTPYARSDIQMVLELDNCAASR